MTQVDVGYELARHLVEALAFGVLGAAIFTFIALVLTLRE